MREAVGGLFLSIAFVLVSVRLCVQARMVRKPSRDDFFLLLELVRTHIIIALQCANCPELSSIAGFSLAITGMNSGLGRRVYRLDIAQADSFRFKVASHSATVLHIFPEVHQNVHVSPSETAFYD